MKSKKIFNERMKHLLSTTIIVAFAIAAVNLASSPIISIFIGVVTICILYLLMSRTLYMVFKLKDSAEEMISGNNILTISDEFNRVEKEVLAGNIGTRLNADLVEADYKNIVVKANKLINNMAKYLDNIPLPFVMLDSDFRFTLVNKIARSQGYDEEALLGKKLSECMPPEESEKMLPHFEKAKKTGEDCTYQMTMISPTGETLIEEHHVIALQDSNKKTNAILLINFDVSDMVNSRKRAEKVNEYQTFEANDITKNLRAQLGKGILKFDYEPVESDADTSSAASSYKMIGDALRYATTFIKGYVNEISDILQKFSNKNFDLEVKQNYLGDFSMIKNSMMELIYSISSLITEIKSASNEVENVSAHIATSTNQIMLSFEEQTTTIERINNDMHQLGSKIKENAKQTNQVNDYFKSVQTAAKEGRQHMEDMSMAMEDINNSSNKILGIVKLIEDIAFQTNLLALNAAVEAARAGEHGKGFAVVAEEVRNLANRSANAVSETSILLDESINRVNTGVKITAQTSSSLQEIESITKNVATLISQIANISSDQEGDIIKINKDMNYVYDKTLENNSLLQSNAATSQELSVQSEQLNALVAKFMIKQK